MFLHAGRQLDGPLPDALRGEAIPLLRVQPPVLAVEQRHHAHAHAQRREAVQVKVFSELEAGVRKKFSCVIHM